ncbi:hypothetical protein [Alkalibacter mobilis]|uniref:hypothetical protein n=1 Tax=Alkalibacter mobilis TaxID=2787712 RepID=UPI00189E80E0|nr:hypothetical protein [Alkalibacter mobilis]MBF7097448.1 hypothetical protein [Alkalibacter mobilis]
MKLPEKFSKIWFLIWIGIFAVIIGSMLAVSMLTDAKITVDNVKAYAIIALGASTLISLGGFMGGKVYFVISLVVNLGGIGYMIYLSMTRAAEGWSDLVSFVSYLFIGSVGILIGIIGQLVVSIRKTGKID